MAASASVALPRLTSCSPGIATSSSSPIARFIPTRRPGHLVKLNTSANPGSFKLPPLSLRATTSEESGTTTSTEEVTKQVEDVVADLKTKWDAVENKSTVLIYGGGALVTLWLSATIVGAINSVPLLPKIMELIGLGYTGWFVYRYLLFKSSRKELLEDVEELKKKITGATE